MQAVPGGRPGSEVIAKGGTNTWAPDIIRSRDRYFLYYSAPPAPDRPTDRDLGRLSEPSRKGTMGHSPKTGPFRE